MIKVYRETYIGYSKKSEVCKRVIFNGIKTQYDVTRAGNVYNRKTKRKIIPAIVRDHYKILIYFNIDGKYQHKQVFVHRIVATAFIPNKKKKPLVHHKDFNPLNNEVSNLQWVTDKEHDIIHRNAGRKKSGIPGEQSNFAQTTDLNVLHICEELLKNQLTPPEIAKKYGVSRKTVTLILHKKRWKHITKDMDFSSYTKLRQVSEKDKQRAIDMIKNTNLSLLEISKITGVSHTYVSHMNRQLNIREKYKST